MKIKGLIFWLIYIAILVGFIYFTPKALSIVLDTEFPMASITSSSMWPVLQKGDLILIKGVTGSEVEEGDIVIYKNPGTGFTIHRVIKKRENSLVTKGDANNVSDIPIKFSDVIGKPVEIKENPIRIPFLGYISLIINKNNINGQAN